MRKVLVGDEFGQQLASIKTSAFRLETQPVYAVTYERDTVAKFIAGNPEPPTMVPALRVWFDQIRQQVRRGLTVERVRVFDEPPTDYQRWETYIERWNLAAGETIYTIPRSRAHQVGLLHAAGDQDFWLLDDTRVMTFSFDETGRRIHTELTDEENPVQQARQLRDLAVRTARGDKE